MSISQKMKCVSSLLIAFAAAVVALDNRQFVHISPSLHPNCQTEHPASPPATLPANLYPWARTALHLPDNRILSLNHDHSEASTVILSHHVLGSGRFGVVVKGCMIERNLTVAVKMELVTANSLNPINLVASTVNQVKNMLNNNDPRHEIRLLKETGILFGQVDRNGLRFTVMKLLPGVTLMQFFSNPSLTGQQYLYAYERVLAELKSKLHDRGFLHGAPHQNNVLIDEKEIGHIDVYFIDFGRGRDMDEHSLGERGYSKYMDVAIIQYYVFKFAQTLDFETSQVKQAVLQRLRNDLKASRKLHLQLLAATNKMGLDGYVLPFGMWTELRKSRNTT
jgi:hypothetical protein